MKRIFFWLLVFVLITGQIVAQVPGKFNYQAVLRNNAGELLVDQSISVRVSVIDNTPTGTVLYREVHSVSTNAYGIVNLVIGDGTADTGDFSQISWGENDKYLGIEIDEGSGYNDIGTNQLLSIPYAIYTETADSAVVAGMAYAAKSADVATLAYTADKLGSQGVYSPNTDTLFVVKDNDGNVVFAVFPDGAQVIVNETIKGSVGGFAVSGRNPAKAEDVEILRITPDSTRIYINDTITAKGKVGGFAISGRNPAKAYQSDILYVTADSTRFFVNEPTVKGKVGGFAVSGRNPAKGTTQPMFFTTADSTRIFTTDADKGFGVSDNSTGSTLSYLQLSPQNYFIGHRSGVNTTGSYNLFLGYESGQYNASGGSNVFIGPEAGKYNLNGFGNIFIGNRAGYLNSHKDSAATVPPEGYYNVYIGFNAGEEITYGQYNTYVGYASGSQGTSGEFNTYIGNQAGNQSNGNNNVFVGVKAGELAREGSNNTFLGYFSGQRCYNGSGNVFLGYAAGYSADVDNKLFIDNSSTASPLIYGDFTNGSEMVQINGDLDITGTLTGGTKSLKLADYVFDSNYDLESIEEHAEFMWKNKHLPSLKSQKNIEAEGGYDMVERRERILEELEKAHIYIEQLNNEIKSVKAENEELKKKLNEIIELLQTE